MAQNIDTLLRTGRLSVSALLASCLFASASGAAELKVKLFGQPCVMSGPVELPALKAIHAISPEQLPAGTSAEEARKGFGLVKNAQGVPSFLDRYRERLTRRLAAQVDFFDALDEAQKTRKAAPLLTLAETRMKPGSHRDFDVLARKLESDKGAAPMESLLELYNQGIEPDPEEDFHRAIRLANVHYNCSFDEEAAEESGEEAAPDAPPAVAPAKKPGSAPKAAPTKKAKGRAKHR